MALTVDMLRCFQAVARHGSLAEAAAVLGRTPPAVSVMLRNFEERVGAPLFETTRKARLTPLGKSIYKTIQAHLEEFDRVQSVIEGAAKAEAGRVRLAVTPTVATALMPQVVNEFSRAYPKVLIEVHDMDSAAVRRELERERADIGIATMSKLNGFERKRLISDELGLLCSSEHPLAARETPLTWKAIEQHKFISNGLCGLIDAPEFRPILENSVLSVSNHASLLAFIRANVGVTVLPQLAIPMKDNDLVFQPMPGKTQERMLYLFHQPSRMVSPAVAEFCRFITSRIQILTE